MVDVEAVDILLIEDNETDVKILLRSFSQEQFHAQVYTVEDGEEGLNFLQHQGKYEDKSQYPLPDIILLKRRPDSP